MEISEACITTHRKGSFSVQDRESVVSFENPEKLQVHEVQVDDCVFATDDGERCDYLIQILQNAATRGNDKSILIELKGSDIDKAFQQLVTTHETLSDHLHRYVWWTISYSGNPRFSTSVQDLQLRARKNHNAKLYVGSTVVLCKFDQTSSVEFKSPPTR